MIQWRSSEEQITFLQDWLNLFIFKLFPKSQSYTSLQLSFPSSSVSCSGWLSCSSSSSASSLIASTFSSFLISLLLSSSSPSDLSEFSSSSDWCFGDFKDLIFLFGNIWWVKKIRKAKWVFYFITWNYIFTEGRIIFKPWLWTILELVLFLLQHLFRIDHQPAFTKFYTSITACHNPITDFNSGIALF